MFVSTVLPVYVKDELRYLAAQYLQRNSSGGVANSEDPQADDWRDLPDVSWGAWKITRVLAEALDARLTELAPRRILEVGSGVSTAVLAAYARRTGAELVTLEHSPVFYMRTKRLLRALGLESYVNLRLSRLAKRKRLRGKPRCYWYQTKLRGTFDFILLDGPPGNYGRIAALPALAGHLAPRWELWLDDGYRDHERECVDVWRDYISFTSELRAVDEKGLWVLQGTAVKTAQTQSNP